MQSRVGRDNQRYGPQGERLVCGVVPLSKDMASVLLIQSTRRGNWVLPKGGWENDEATPIEAAKREAWEEAGIICRVVRDLGMIDEKRPEDILARPEVQKDVPKASYHFFEVIVEKEEADWPEAKKRARKWVAVAEAREALKERPELLEALERSISGR